MRWKQKLLDTAQSVAGSLSDRAYLSLQFRRTFWRWPALRTPRSFNEHILHFKLSSRGDARLPMMADKIAVKDHVANTVGSRYVIPTIWYGAELPPRGDRNWPKPYVLKSAHGSGQNIFVREGDTEDWDQIEATVREWMSSSYQIGRNLREWHYEHIPRRVLVESMIGVGDIVPPDYKLFVFGGRVGLIWKDEGRYASHRRYTFDSDWKPLPFDFFHRRGSVDPPRPDTLPEMIRVAEALGEQFEFVSIDLYDVDGRVYFGEMTFTPAGGMGRFYPPEGDFQLGALWPTRGIKTAKGATT